VSAPVDRDHAVRPTEVFDLRTKVAMIAGETVDQEDRRRSGPRVLVRESDAVPTEIRHRALPTFFIGGSTRPPLTTV
jgi:hypothetical protein